MPSIVRPVLATALVLGLGTALVPLASAGPGRPAAPVASASASSEPESADATACIAAYEQVQTLREQGQLLAAREQAIGCARDTCPKVLAAECAQWLDQIAQSIPSVVLGAQGPDGKDLVDVRVLLDRKPFMDRIGARAEPVDPGSHVFRFESATFGAVELEVMVREGERNRRIVATFEKKAAPAPAQAPAPSESNAGPMVGWTLGALGIVGIGIGVVFEAMGLSKASDLEACKPACPAEDTEEMSRNFVVGDVSLVAGGVALAAGIIVLIATTSGESATEASAPSARFVVVPTDHGAVGTLTTRF